MRILLEKYSNLSVMKKSMMSPIFMILMLTFLLISIVINLNSVMDTVDNVINNLAPDTKTATEIMEKVYGKRLQVKTYIKTSDDKATQQFKVIATELTQLIAKARLEITNPKRVVILDEIERLNKEYDIAFYNTVVKNMNIRNEVVKNIMDVEGPSAEKNLSRLMESAFEDGDVEAAYYAGETLRSLLLARLYAFKFLNENSVETKNRTFKELKTAQEWLNKLLANLESYDRIQTTKKVSTNIQKYVAAFQQVVDAIENRNKAINTILDVDGPKIATKAVELNNNIFEAMVEEGIKIHHKLTTTEIATLGVYLLAAILGLLISIQLAKGIVKPISIISQAISQVAKGNLTTKIDLHSKDELGMLANDFNGFIHSLKLLITDISNASDELASATTETSVVTKETSKNIVDQQSETALVATAINELAAAVSEVAANTEQASIAASDGDTQAKSGQVVINEIVGSIEKLVSEIDASSNVIQILKEESISIGTVLDVIKSIAEQTNLLALNAAIEAARAGEQGRGFAVVADEVRSLAQKTQDSTKQIEELISKLQNNADNAVSSMSINKESVSALASKTTIATESLDTISNVVSSISDMNAQIATAAQEQNYVVEEVNRNIHTIKTISDNTSIASEKVLSATTILDQLSNTLKTQVSKFKIN